MAARSRPGRWPAARQGRRRGARHRPVPCAVRARPDTGRPVGQREWSDLSEQQRSHLMRELDSEVAYQRRKAALRLLERLQQGTDPEHAVHYARAIALLQGAAPTPEGRSQLA
ncbi:hypothetical protein [Glutamicibacter sp. BSL13]